MGNTVSAPEKESRVKNARQTVVRLVDRSVLYISIFTLATPIIGFYLFRYMEWWMFFCVLLVGFIQLMAWANIISSDEPLNTYFRTKKKRIYVSELDDYVKSEKRIDMIVRILFVVIAVLDLYPFFASSNSFMLFVTGSYYGTYEGGVFVTLMTIILVGIWLFTIFMGKPSIIANQELMKKYGITIEEKEAAEKKAKKDAHELQLKKQLERYGEGYISLGNNLFVNESTNKFFVHSKEYGFKDILSFVVQDNATTIYSPSTSTAKTNTGSMLGRAVAGGVLLGNVGAVIGGATASKTIEHSASESSVVHDYSVVITVNSISSPTETIRLGDDVNTLNKIVSTLTVIINRNQSS